MTPVCDDDDNPLSGHHSGPGEHLRAGGPKVRVGEVGVERSAGPARPYDGNLLAGDPSLPSPW